ncbi:MAG: hypothetical protein ACP5N3_02305 [Candidatus Nanoarchaeia archaeon]
MFRKRKNRSPNVVGSLFVVSFVLGFGFLSGFWINLGFNPKEELMKIIAQVVLNIFPNPLISFLFWAMPFVAVSFSIYLAYRKGGFLGLAAVALAFSAGLAMISVSAFIILGVAIVLGFISPFVKKIEIR